MWVGFKIFFCGAPGMEKYGLDLLRPVENREYAMEIGCGDVSGL